MERRAEELEEKAKELERRKKYAHEWPDEIKR